MGTILFLIFFPMIIAFILLVVKADKGRDVIVIASAALIAAMSIVVAIQFSAGGGDFCGERRVCKRRSCCRRK